MKKLMLIANIALGIILLITAVYLSFAIKKVSIWLLVPFILYGLISGYDLTKGHYSPIGNKVFNVFMILVSLFFISGIVCLIQQAIIEKKVFSGYLLFLGCGILILIIGICLFIRNIQLIKRREKMECNSHNESL